MYYPEPIAKLIDAFSRLPGIGPKTAGRLAFQVLRMKEEDVTDFAKALINVKRNLHYCSVCCNITDVDPCRICQDKGRDASVICVVQEPKDQVAMERTKELTATTTSSTGQSHRWKALVRTRSTSPTFSNG